VVAAPLLDPSSVLSQLLPLLAPSAAFVIFSPWLPPLTACMDQLQHTKQAVALQLTEPWYREHQGTLLCFVFCSLKKSSDSPDFVGCGASYLLMMDLYCRL